jgi:hypothetical protein
MNRGRTDTNGRWIAPAETHYEVSVGKIASERGGYFSKKTW